MREVHLCGAGVGFEYHALNIPSGTEILLTNDSCERLAFRDVRMPMLTHDRIPFASVSWC